MEYTEFHPEHWEAYKQVNEKYAETVVDHLDDDDVVWVHDYQLLLLPEYIRKKKTKGDHWFFQPYSFPFFMKFLEPFHGGKKSYRECWGQIL